MMFSRKKKTGVPSRRLRTERLALTTLDAGGQFRRNRTRSGVRRGSPDIAQSERAQAHHLARKRRKVGGILLLVLGVIIILALLITQFTARVIVAHSTEPLTNPIQAPAYEEAINEYLGVHPAARLRFVLNQGELSEYVTTVAPEVAKVSQTGSKNIVETQFTLTFRKPVAGWQINGHQYYVDDHGIVFEKNYYEAPTVQIVDKSGISPEQGSAVASARLLSFVGRIVSLAKGSGYEVSEVLLPSGTTRQIEIRLQDVKPLVKLSIDRGAGEQTEDMVRVINYLTSQGMSPDYIDVRVPGRAVYQ